MRKEIIIAWIFVVFFVMFTGCHENNHDITQEHEEVVIRKIGHEILLLANDSVSRVLPITKEENKYRLQFEANFGFVPDCLVMTIDSIIKSSLSYQHYLVEVEQCETRDIIYSFEIGGLSDSSIVPCSTRIQPNACYEIVIQLVPEPAEHASSYNKYLWFLLIIPLFIVVFYVRRKRSFKQNGTVMLGNYLFDKNNMHLIFDGNKIELTSKEVELLDLLYQSINNTLKRETILNKIWGDEGDYVGRTLDVFISKLRKKLEDDPSIKVRNIRGIGYKLTIE